MFFEITSPGVVYRGHFKDYREKGLFWPSQGGCFGGSSHVRGKRALEGQGVKNLKGGLLYGRAERGCGFGGHAD